MDTNDRDLIADAVYRGVSKAIGVYLLASAVLWTVFWVITTIMANAGAD